MPAGVFIDDLGGVPPAAAVRGSQWRISHPIPEQPTAVVAEADFYQDVSQWAPLVNNTAGPVVGGGANIQTYSVGEGELEDLGGGLVKWVRRYASIPVSYTIWGTCPKTIKYLITQWPNGIYSTANVVSTTKTVRCQITYDFGFNVTALPGVPDVVLYTLAGQTGSNIWLVDGWPASSPGNPNSNNAGNSFIGGDIDVYMGGILRRKQIWGPL